MSNYINRNTSVFSHIRNKIRRNNTVAPDFVVRHLWMEDPEPSGVEIIELNSVNSSEDSEEDRPVKYSQAWSYINNGGFSDSDNHYEINQEARQRRRANNMNDIANNYCIYDYKTDTAYTPAVKAQPNCLTIINNHIDLDSSSDDEYAIGVVEENGDDYWDHVYNEGLDNEQRMIWIYSFGNRRLLTENTFEHVNIPGLSSESSSSSEKTQDKCINACRIASPIPGNYIPRLDLSIAQTLSTVTEVSYKKSESSDEALKPKRLNNWLSSRVNVSKCSKILDWMALSPRDKKRKYTDTGIVTEELVYGKHNFAKGQGDVDKESKVTQVEVNVHKETPSKLEVNETVRTKIVDIDSIETLTEDNTESEATEFKLVDLHKVPNIDITPRIIKSQITSSIEKLESNNWIIDERNVDKASHTVSKNDVTYNFCKDISHVTNENELSQKLYVKNMSLLRPSPWTEYLPITSSRHSLHLSLSCSSIESSSTWFKWLINMFKCCRTDI